MCGSYEDGPDCMFFPSTGSTTGKMWGKWFSTNNTDNSTMAHRPTCNCQWSATPRGCTSSSSHDILRHYFSPTSHVGPCQHSDGVGQFWSGWSGNVINIRKSPGGHRPAWSNNSEQGAATSHSPWASPTIDCGQATQEETDLSNWTTMRRRIKQNAHHHTCLYIAFSRWVQSCSCHTLITLTNIDYRQVYHVFLS